MIHLVGVSHIKANTGKVIEELKKLNIDSDTLIFIEPKKNILTGIETCDKKSIEYFFVNILRYIMSKKAKIVPLNPRYVPSHKSTLLYQKYAKQFAEEEYMAELIIKRSYSSKTIVIMGDVHAVRVNGLLKKKGCKTEYIKLSPLTPDDIIAHSWRAALEGRASEFIGISWLNTINEEIRERMNLPKNINVQEACWNDEYLYKKYLALVKELMKKHKAKDFIFKINEQMKGLAHKAKKSGEAILNKYSTIEDHPVFDFPYEIRMNAIINTS